MKSFGKCTWTFTLCRKKCDVRKEYIWAHRKWQMAYHIEHRHERRKVGRLLISFLRNGYGVDIQYEDLWIMFDTIRKYLQITVKEIQWLTPLTTVTAVTGHLKCWNNGHMNGQTMMAETDGMQRHNVWVANCLISNSDQHQASTMKPSFKENVQSFKCTWLLF